MPVKPIKPMLAHLGTQDDLHHADYIYEPKLDGVRALCQVDGALKFMTRNNNNITHKYPEFDFRSRIKAKTAILDGEIIMYDQRGTPSFTLLQRRELAENKGAKAIFAVFDILMKNGKWLLDKPLLERKKILQQTIQPKDGLFELVLHTRDGVALWRAIKKRNMEGVMAKQEASHYVLGKRSWNWIKVKTHNELEAVIIGFTQEKRHISALALGLYDKQGNLTYIGKVGTGFDTKTIAKLYAKFKKVTRQTPPCPCPLKGVIWMRPLYVAEIKFLEWTRDKRLRAPVFMGLRTDKKAKECTFDQS